MKQIKTLLLATILTVVILNFLAKIPKVWAHADLVRAKPAPNEVLLQPPSELSIWFTESLESQFADIQVLDSNGQRVDLGNTTVDPLDHTKVTVSLKPMGNGFYTVAWSNVSKSDGHRVRGTYLFSVGMPLSGSVDDNPEQPLVQSPLEPVFRWLTLVGIMSVLGGQGFLISVADPAIEREVPKNLRLNLSSLMRERSANIMMVGLGVFSLASLSHLVLQSTISFDSSFIEVLGRPLLNLLIQTNWGRVWLVRMGAALLLLIGLLSFKRAVSPDHYKKFQWLVLISSLAILLCLSLTSHAAATDGIEAAAVFNDFLHLLAATIWIGGLFHLIVFLPHAWSSLQSKQRSPFLATLATRFSRLGLISMALLAATGFYSSWAQVTLPAAISTPYGRVLLFKTGLVISILGLAGLNLLWVRPRLKQNNESHLWLLRLVKGEAGLAVLVLLLTGLLTALEPARQVASRQGIGQEHMDLVLNDLVNEKNIQLVISPGKVGRNQLILNLEEDIESSTNETDEVSFQLSFLGSDLGSQTMIAVYEGNGRYVSDNVLLNLPGTWQILVRKYQLDAPDIHSAFRFQVELLGNNASTISPSIKTGLIWWMIELVLLGLSLIWMGMKFTQHQQKQLGTLGIIPGLLSLGLALYLVMRPIPKAQTTLAGDSDSIRNDIDLPEKTNPFLPDIESVKLGQQVYEAHCMICHGLTGHGDGPRGLGTDAVDIIEHIPLHAGIEYFEIVADHINRGDMRNNTKPIDENEIWHLVNYLEILEEEQAKAENIFSQARVLAEQGEFEKALSWLNQALELSPRYIQALQGRGILSSELGDQEQAITDHSRVIELDPTFSEGYYYRAQVYQTAGRWTEAISDLQAYLELSPQTSEREVIQKQISELQEIISSQPSSRINNISLKLEDFPAGFTQYPVKNLGLAPGNRLNGGTFIDSSFAFAKEDRFELIWGFVSSIKTKEQKDDFDSRLNISDLTQLISSGLQAESVLSPLLLSLPEGIGDISSGMTAVFVSAGTQAQVQSVAFRKGDLGAYLFLMNDKDEDSSITIINLATILSRRMN